MNPHLQKILDIVSKSSQVTEREKAALAKEIEDAGKELERKGKTVASQQRELQLEGALEKVRARAMAMGNSDELREVVAVIYEQMIPLGFAALGCELILCDEKNEELQYWSSTPEQTLLPECYRIPRNIHPFFKKAWEAWKKQTPRFVYVNEGLEKGNFDDLIFEKTAFKNFPEHVKNSIRAGKIDVFSFVTTKFGLLEAVDDKPLSEEKFQVLERFAKVFEQTYTRFLDLQKAEAQAREAQIEAALERIRARALAMHTSEELIDVANVLREQMGLLGQPELEASVIELYEVDDQLIESWYAFRPVSNLAGKIITGTSYFPKGSCLLLSEMLEMYHSSLNEYTLMASGDKLEEFIKVLIHGSPEIVQYMNQEDSTPETMYYHFSDFSGGSLCLTSGIEPTEEAKNLQRRAASVFDLAYRRFLDLQKAEAQAREAQLEAALERVRSRTMGMQKSNELAEILGKIFEELHLLDVELARCIIWIIDPIMESARMWFASSEISGGTESYHIPKFNHTYYKKYIAAWKARKAIWPLEISGKLKKSWDQYLFEETELKKLPKEAIMAMRSPDIIFTSNTFNQYGLLCTAGSEPLSEESTAIFQRFGQVFEQSYTRFEDIKNAEAQAREAQIEAALERVRASTLAMHKSQDLAETALVLYDQFTLLGNNPDRMSIGIFTEETKEVALWPTDQTGGGLYQRFTGSWERSEVMTKMYKAWKAGNDSQVVDLSGQNLKVWLKFIRDEMKLFVDDTNIKGRRVQQAAFFSHGFLLLTTNDPVPHDTMQLLMRFAGVFSQTYTRFLDLQKAEAQTREAQIEASLERIRARALAMHTSEELIDVANILREQMALLDQPELEAVVINLYEVDDQLIETWYAFRPLFNISGEIIMGRGHSQKGSCLLLSEMLEMYHSSLNEYTLTASGEKLEAFINALIQGMPEIVQYMNQEDSAPETMYYHFSDFSGGSLCMASGMEPSEEAKNLLRRAASVFGLAYRRFLDLQKAEAQAREAQIEAALERVRSRTMAMHRSEELPEVALVLWEQLKQLNLKGLDGCAIHVYDDEAGTFDAWAAFPDLIEGERKMKFNMFTSKQGCIWAYEEWDRHYRAGVTDFCAICNKQQLNEFINWFAPTLPLLANEFRSFDLDTLYINGIAFSNGILGAPSIEPLSAETWAAFKRLAAVFDLAYRRFEDLQKAEAQTREAEIELALERVRAKALAMHNSEDLWAVTGVLRDQMALLGEKDLESTIIHIYDRKIDEFEAWYSYRNPEDPHGKIIDGKAVLKWNKTARTRLDRKKYLDKETDYTIVADHQMLKEWYDYLDEVAPMVVERDEQGAIIVPEVLYYNYSKFSGGALLLITGDEAMENSKNLLKRSAEVFNLAYTRFLDLQKAEAQAREAQIEAALERIRASTMAMHKTDELSGVIKIFFRQFELLGLTIDTCVLDIIKEGSNGFNIWIAAGTETYPEQVHVPFLKHPMFTRLSSARAKKKEFLVMALDNRSKETFFDHFYKNATHIKVPKKRKDLIAKGVGIHASWALLPHANIGLWNYRGTAYNEEENQILARMGQVFEQTYTRFLDLQKAEAQAREAKIEAALEKVRSQSLAMHTTSEMQLVANAVYEQLHALGLEMDVVGMSGAIEAKKDYDVWVGGAPLGSALRIPYNEDTKVQRDYNKMLEERPELFAKTYSGKVKKEYIDRLLTHGEFPKALRRKMETSDAFTTLIAPKKNSGIQVVRYSDQPFTEQDAEILKRFAGVFEQAYIRFMDLEKAEAQAREAQIQLALERVRAKSLAMKNSDELHQVLGVLFRQFDHLGIEPVNVFLSLFNREDRTLTYRASGKSGTRVPAKQVISVDSMEVLKALFDKWVNDNSDTVEVIYYPKEVLPQLFGIFAETFSSMPEGDRMGVDDFPDGGFSMAGHTPFGYLGYDHQRQATEEEKDILSRFCVEFTRVYQRFLDIQKAEAQAREAQIEMALEKIRSRTMAMQKSEELEETAALLFNQINNLGIQTFTSGFNIWQEAETAFMSYMAMPTGEMAVAMRTPLTEDVFFKNIYNAKKRGEDFFVFESEGESLAETYRYMGALPTVGKVVQSIKDSGFALPAFQITHCGFFPQGHLMFITLEPHPEAWDIFRRFTKVFEQTYTRFLDLQKAEARARESQIEMALEKVRSRTMAMHQSEELGEVASVMFEQISMLTSTPDRFNIGIANEADESFDIWVTDQNGHQVNRLFVARADKSPVISAFFKARKTKKSLAMDLHGKELKAWVRYMNKEVGIPFKEGQLKEHRHINSVFFSHGFIGVTTNEPLEKETFELIGRFAKVFQQTYVRFLDLQKAEAQARESQIEVALERVRSRAMAMHHTDELTDVLGVLFDQFDFLGINPVLTHLTLFDEENETFTLRITTGGKNRTIAEQLIDVNAVESWKTSFANWKKSELHAVDCIDYPPEVLPAVWEVLDEVMGALPEGQKLYPEDFPNGLYTTQGHCKYGYIGFNHSRRATEEEKEIVIRFAKEFGRLYQRFLDIQKAEVQAREAQIEAALERVRSKTMAMHNSHDVSVTVVTLFDEVSKLGLDDSIRCGIGILEGTERMETWSAKATPDGAVDLKMGLLNMTVHPLLVGVKNAWIGGKKSYSYELKGAEVRRYYQALNAEPDYPFNADLDALPKREFHNSFYFSAGILFAFTENPMTEEASSVLKRFAGVFGQTYRRYLDLLKAETQAREAQIEAALERLRSRSMAMQHSSELNLILAKVFEELTLLDLEMERAVIWTYSPEDRSVRWWAANPEAESGTESYFIGDCDDPVYNEYWKAWEERRTKYLYILEGAYKENWTDILFNQTELGRLPEIVKERMAEPEKIYLYNTFNEFGVLFVACLEPLADEKFNVLERFGKVFDQSYTRFNDIKQAELREKEAIKQSSLDRVRGQIASMRSTADLDRITPLVWNELTILGVPFIRCGVFIIDEATQIVKAYLSSPNGASLGVLDLPFAASDLTSDSVTYWKKKKVLHRHWNKEEFVAWTESLMGQGLLKNKATYQGTAEPPESLDLHFIPFDQGMLYVGSEAALTVFQIDLVQALANAFSVAYARYEDFAELEKAKESIENTLTELKATQNQLVQSEKMASLGELTAGIAHEIQNPLNFVNNFSEVSKELLEEMMEEMAKGDVGEVKAIAEDVIQNLEKIVHHGKRADGIVKGMLQHSRSSSGVKEPTDINVLADEYLRLAYHGLRAKEKTFNATLQTHFDETIGSIHIIPQDMGRVILNLITNAFYVVKEKKEQAPKDYEPTVTVTTRKEKDKILLMVKDNGNGIPKKVLDKIFQPFFTTKPTGEGTGLGLSMSYDIVTKGHAGELEVKTKEGEGSEFIITLPIDK